MAYKCLECGNVFEEGERARWEEHHPYGMGYAAEEFSGCPVCNGGYKETRKCDLCEGEFLDCELKGDNVYVCEDCINEYRNNFDVCYKISINEKEQIKISALLSSLLSEDEIETILYHYLKTRKNNDCSKFIDENRDWFADKLVEEVSK
jgi:hypothetical protein